MATGAIEDDADGVAAEPAPALSQQQLADPAAGPLSGITGLDVCARKPVFATCGADRTVRLWSYTTAASTVGGLLSASGSAGGERKGSIVGSGAGLGEDYLTPTLELVQVRSTYLASA